MRDGRGSPNPLEDRGALGGAERGRIAMVDDFRGGVDETARSSSGREITVLPSSAGCFASMVVAIAVDNFRPTHTALGEVLPAFGNGYGRIGGSTGIGTGSRCCFDSKEAGDDDSDCSEHDDSTR